MEIIVRVTFRKFYPGVNRLPIAMEEEDVKAQG
jgi:hypothetical protein